MLLYSIILHPQYVTISSKRIRFNAFGFQSFFCHKYLARHLVDNEMYLMRILDMSALHTVRIFRYAIIVHLPPFSYNKDLSICTLSWYLLRQCFEWFEYIEGWMQIRVRISISSFIQSAMWIGVLGWVKTLRVLKLVNDLNSNTVNWKGSNY